MGLNGPMAKKQKAHDLATLGGRLAFAREQRGKTQGELAAAAGVAQPTLSKIERGDVKEPWGILALAQALECNPYWLERGEELGGQWDAEPVFQRTDGTPVPAASASTLVETIGKRLLSMEEVDRLTVAKRFGDLAVSPDSAIARAALARAFEIGPSGLGGSRGAPVALPATGTGP